MSGSQVRPGIEQHLALCAECRLIVEDLRVFRTELQQEESRAPRMRRLFLAAAAVLVVVAGASVWLARRAVVSPPALPQLVSSLNDAGRTLGLTVSGDLVGADGLEVSTQQMLRATLASGRLPAGPGALQPNSEKPVLRSEDSTRERFAVLSPVGVRQVSDRPWFRWTPLHAASTYEVVVFDAELQEVARSGKLTGTEWRPERPLPRRLLLTWQVAAEGPGGRVTAPRPPEPSPVFEILSGDAALRIETARSPQPPSHLALAILYASEGLPAEAAEELDRLAALNRNSKLVDSLSQSVHGR